MKIAANPVSDYGLTQITFVRDGYFRLVGIVVELDNRRMLYRQDTAVGKWLVKRLAVMHNLPRIPEDICSLGNERLTTVLTKNCKLHLLEGNDLSQYAYVLGFNCDETNIHDRSFMVMTDVTEDFVRGALTDPTHPLYDRFEGEKPLNGAMVDIRPYVKYCKVSVCQ